MITKNWEYLKDQLRYHGFGESLLPELQKNMQAGFSPFALAFRAEISQTPLEAALYFRKGEGTDLYFWNRWEAKLLTEVGARQQTFYLNQGSGITLKEGYNLLEGRAVFKELTGKDDQKYSAWLQLDLRGEKDLHQNYKMAQYHPQYGFDLVKSLEALPLRELATTEARDQLIRSLQRGNIQPVTFEKNGFAEKLLLEAAPRFKSLNVRDLTGKVITAAALEKRYALSGAVDGPALAAEARRRLNGGTPGEGGPKGLPAPDRAPSKQPSKETPGATRPSKEEGRKGKSI